jgi:DNA-binding CsgD family transcriptional regulator
MEGVSAAGFGLFGREEHVGVVAGLLTTGGSAVVGGEPGTGKSSLLGVFGQLAQRGGRRVLTVTPTQFDQGLPFAGLAELASQVPERVAASLPDPQRRALEVALQRADPDGADVDPLAVPLAARGAITVLCEAEPVAVVIDDLQWLDPATTGSLAFALRRLALPPERLVVLVGTRPEGGGSDVISALGPSRHDLKLGPLDEGAIGQLLRRRTALRWTPPMSAGVARASGGNPFLALMIAEAMQSEASRWRWSAQDGHDPVFPVPPSLAGILGEKVALLPDDAREVLLLASAAGRITLGQLDAIVGPARVREALEAAVDRDVARVGAGSTVAFGHPMLASAIYDAAEPSARRHAHRILAEFLDDPVERARHRARTVIAPVESVALELEHAADISRGRGAQSLAAELLEAAASATPVDTDPAAAFTRWLAAVDAHMGAGDEAAATAALDQVHELATTSDMKAQVLLRRSRLVRQFIAARELAEQALRLLPPGDPLRAEVLVDIGEIHRMEGHGRLARRLAQLALADATERGDLGGQLAALNLKLMVERLWGVRTADQTYAELAALADNPALDGPLHPLSWIRTWLGSFFAPWDDDGAEKRAREGIESLVQAGQYGVLSHLYVSLVMVLIRSSNVADAASALDEADRVGAWVSTLQPQEYMAHILVRAYQGDVDVARRLTVEALAARGIQGLAYWRGGFLAQLGFIETSARDWQAALVALRELAGLFAHTGMVDLEQLLWPVDYADAALQVGALDEVETAVGLLRRQGAAGRPEATVAADRCQALLTAARGDTDVALHELVRITDLADAECPFEAARSQLALGQVYRRAGYKGMSSQTLGAAGEAFDAVGAPRWAERARHEAGRTGLHHSAGLTVTERRVAQLVAAGRSNQETADELFISAKTVEANLTRIYRKLAVRSRTELAARLSSKQSDLP